MRNGRAEDLGRRPGGAACPERVLLGMMLHRLREARGLPAREAGGAIGASPAKISRMELGQTRLREPNVAALPSTAWRTAR